MMKKRAIALIALFLVVSAPAFAGKKDGGCKDKDVVGSYLYSLTGVQVINPYPPNDPLDRTYITQINLNEGGTALGYSTSFPDFLIASGTASPIMGSWACQKDGKLLLTYIYAGYDSTGTGDVALAFYVRGTSLYEVVDQDMIVRVQGVVRVYDPTEDPADPDGGSLGSPSYTEIPYLRLSPSDADLTP